MTRKIGGPFKHIVNYAVYRIKNILYKRKEKREKEAIEAQTKHLALSVPELFMHEHNGKVFNRYDMIVRLLAIECENRQNNYGWDMYRKMQCARIDEDWVDLSVDRFKNLIHSYNENGYDAKSEIELDCNLHLIDGSHRMAMALYHGINTINVKIRPYEDKTFYGIEFFYVNGFTKEEIGHIIDRYKQIRNNYKRIQPFVCTLWNPVREYFDVITDHLSLFGRVLEVRDYSLSEKDYKFYTRAIYNVDDIENWKIEKKIEYMTANKSEIYQIRMVVLDLDAPDFRLKVATNRTLSRRCEFIKQLIRDAYKTKIENYFYDIIMHIGDNFYQNAYIKRIMTMPRIDVKSILSNISSFNYVITKTENDYMPKDFPVHYPLGKDIDIVCADQKEYTKVLCSVLKDVEQYKNTYDIRYIEKKEEGKVYRTQIRFELENLLIFQFDISCRTGRLPVSFSKELCQDREKRGIYYVPIISNELLVRIDEITNNPEKKHHIEYVKKKWNKLDVELCEKWLYEEAKETVNKIRNEIVNVK